MPSTPREELLGTAEELAGLGSWTLDLETLDCSWSDGMYRLHRLAPQSAPASVELHMTYVHAEDRDTLRALLARLRQAPAAAANENIDLDYRIVLRDGDVREIHGRGRVEADDRGGGRFFGVAQDVTEQRMSERELLAHYSVAQALRDWESFDEGVVVLLRRMSTALEFPTASMWTLDRPSGDLVCRAICSQPGFDATEWEAVTKALRFRPGEGLPGRVWITQQPISSPDVANDPEFRRGEVATASGIASALLIPVSSPRGPVAVLVFYSYERREPSERLLRTLTGIGTELGRFLESRLGRLGPSPLSAREREVLQLASEGLSGPQVAERLVVSPSTVKTHFENIYEKLGVGDRAGAVAYAMRLGIIE